VARIVTGHSDTCDRSRSALKDVTPDAVDVSDVQSAKEVISITEAERRIVELEQKRLGVDPSKQPGPTQGQAVQTE